MLCLQGKEDLCFAKVVNKAFIEGRYLKDLWFWIVRKVDLTYYLGKTIFKEALR